MLGDREVLVLALFGAAMMAIRMIRARTDRDEF
jgi:hypothetical protein